MRKTNACLAILMLAVATAPCTPAADGGPFLGVGVGYSSVDGVANAAANGPFSQFPPASVSIDGLPFDGDATFTCGILGYNFNRYVGIELSYWELGEFESVPLSLQGDRATLSVDEWALSGRFRYPLTQSLAAFWFAGVSRASFEARGVILAIGRIGTFEIPLASPQDETGLFWGTGFGWQFSRSLGVSVEYRQHRVKVTDVEAVGLTIIWSL